MQNRKLISINEKTRELVDFQYSTFNRSLLPLLKEKGIVITFLSDYEKAKEWLLVK